MVLGTHTPPEHIVPSVLTRPTRRWARCGAPRGPVRCGRAFCLFSSLKVAMNSGYLLACAEESCQSDYFWQTKLTSQVLKTGDVPTEWDCVCVCVSLFVHQNDVIIFFSSLGNKTNIINSNSMTAYIGPCSKCFRGINYAVRSQPRGEVPWRPPFHRWEHRDLRFAQCQTSRQWESDVPNPGRVLQSPGCSPPGWTAFPSDPGWPKSLWEWAFYEKKVLC